MNTEVPVRRLIKIALLTTPFFGLSGATPGFLIGQFNLSSVVGGFCFLAFFTAFIWSINILLLWVSYNTRFLKNFLTRFTVSAILTVLITVVIFFILKEMKFPGKLIVRQNMPPFSDKMVLLPVMQSQSINVIVFILIELMLLRDLKRRVTLENEKLKSANLEAKINSLKEQLHPHFLFNSLSTLRSLIGRSPEKAENYLEKLAMLLRFSIENNKAVISLKDEMAQCTNYLNMQKVRFGEALHVRINIPEEKCANNNAPVYSLQLLAENAIKHNILTIENPLEIEFVYNGITNEIVVANNLQPRPRAMITTGTGLANLDERYKLLGYEGIGIRKTDTRFSVSIQLIHNESSNN